MGHHSDQPFDGDPEAFKAFRAMTEEAANEDAVIRKQRLLRDLMDTTGFIGATGMYPEGKLTPQDEGGIQFAIGEQNGKVVIDFGNPVHWLAMSPQQAADFASSLLSRARLVGRKQGETVTLTIGA